MVSCINIFYDNIDETFNVLNDLALRADSYRHLRRISAIFAVKKGPLSKSGFQTLMGINKIYLYLLQ